MILAGRPMPAPPRAAGSWTLTLVDLGLLVLTFFVLQAAALNPWRAVDAGREGAVAVAVDVAPAAGGDATDLGYLEAVLADRVAALPLFAGARWQRAEGELVLHLPAARLAGEGGLPPAAAADLARLGEALRYVDNAVLVRAWGAGGAAPETWHGLLAQAQAVAAALARGDPGGSVAVEARLARPGEGDTVALVVGAAKEGTL